MTGSSSASSGRALRIDGLEYKPVPDSWIRGGQHMKGRGSRLVAVSTAAADGDVLVRYVHPVNDHVARIRFVGADGDGGIIPKPVTDPDDFRPLSIIPRDTYPLELSESVPRLGERERLSELYRDYLERHTAYGADPLGDDRDDDGARR